MSDIDKRVDRINQMSLDTSMDMDTAVDGMRGAEKDMTVEGIDEDSNLLALPTIHSGEDADEEVQGELEYDDTPAQEREKELETVEGTSVNKAIDNCDTIDDTTPLNDAEPEAKNSYRPREETASTIPNVPRVWTSPIDSSDRSLSITNHSTTSNNESDTEGAMPRNYTSPLLQPSEKSNQQKLHKGKTSSVDKLIKSSFGTIRSSIDTVKNKSMDGVKGFAEITRKLATDSYDMGSRTLHKAFSLIKGTGDVKVREGGFVTFSSLMAKQQTLQMIHHSHPYTFEIHEGMMVVVIVYVYTCWMCDCHCQRVPIDSCIVTMFSF